MRTGLMAFGIILIVIGAVFYLVPTPTGSATATTITDGDATVKSSYAAVHIPTPLSIAVLLIGFILFVTGAVLPSRGELRRMERPVSSTHVETVEEVDDSPVAAKRTVTRERHIHKIIR